MKSIMDTNNKFKDSLKTNINPSKEFLENQLNTLLDKYLNQNNIKARQYFSYLICAIYLTYRELYPDLSIYIPFRIKSDSSFIKNIQKEFANGINSVDFKNPSYITEYDALKNDFSLDKATTDINAATIVLSHIKSSLKTNIKYISPEIESLRKKREENRLFIEDVEEKLKDSYIGEEEYTLLVKETLEKIIDSTYDEFTDERIIPYKTELTQILNSYKIKSNSESFSTTITPEQVTSLNSLLNDLRSRLSDKLQYEILRETIPNVFESPLIKNALHANVEFVKDSKKPNGFAAIYYNIHTPYGDIELQLQSNKRYYEAKKGSAFHSGIKGKSVNIDSFFELANPDDDKPLDFYLSKLESFPADQIVSEIELPKFKDEAEKEDFLKTPFGKKYLMSSRIKEYMKHIKIKDFMTFNSDSPTHSDVENAQNSSKDRNKTSIKIDTDKYLLDLALSISPYMNVCHSGHTSFSTANTQAKSLEDEFSEVLRKKDSISCLRNILIERLKQICKTSKNKYYVENTRLKSLLPNDVSRADIIDYAKSLNNELEQKESDLEL